MLDPGRLIFSVPVDLFHQNLRVFFPRRSWTNTFLLLEFIFRFRFRFPLPLSLSPKPEPSERGWALGSQEEAEINSGIKMEVGIEDCLHIEFEYNKSKCVFSCEIALSTARGYYCAPPPGRDSDQHPPPQVLGWQGGGELITRGDTLARIESRCWFDFCANRGHPPNPSLRLESHPAL